ncbi:unnamed protein product [Sphagnum jensenii]
MRVSMWSVETWEEYNELSIDSKKVYFDGKVKRANTMHMYINTNQDAIRFTISLPIVDVIIRDLLYHDDNQILANVDEVDNEDEQDHHMNMERIHKKAEKKIALKHNAMKFFKLDDDNEMYTVDVLNNTRFFLAINYISEAHHGYEQRDVPKEDELVGAPQWHAQVLHLASTQDCRAHKRPWAFRVVIDQVVHDHARRCVNDQRDQQDCLPVAQLIAHHRPTKDQDRAPQEPVDQYVQSQGHH